MYSLDGKERRSKFHPKQFFNYTHGPSPVPPIYITGG